MIATVGSRSWRAGAASVALTAFVLVSSAVAAAGIEGHGSTRFAPLPGVLAQVDGEPADPAEELADEHGQGQGGLLSADPGAAVWNLLIFLAVLLILGKFVWPPLLGGLRAREQKIHDELHSAAQANREARRLLEQYNEKLAATAEETQAMLAQARKDAEAAGQRIVEQARVEADHQRDRAITEIGNAKRAAVAELADQTTNLAVQLARQVVGRELSPADHADLIRQSLDNLPRHN